jgi:hypothetical protein
VSAVAGPGQDVGGDLCGDGGSQVISARNVLMLEVGQDECDFSGVADLVGASGDVAQDRLSGFQEGEGSFALGA